MAVRNLSPQRMFADFAANRTPELTFSGKNKRQFSAWKRKALPRVLACLGDTPGPYGKEPVMGNESSREMADNISQHRYNYGEVMVQKGFVTYSIDWIGFGERNDHRKPNNWGNIGGRDWCNLYHLHATMAGMTSVSIMED